MQPTYDDKGEITIEGAKQVFASKGSVIFKGQVYSNLASMPAPFGQGDAKAPTTPEVTVDFNV